MPGGRENRVPLLSEVGPEAWEAALAIDEEIAKLLAEHGFTRKDGRSKTAEAVAQMVQHAIDKARAA